MNTYRKNAIIAGVLWIAATVVPILGMVVVQYIQYIDAPDYLATVAANANKVKTGALIELVYAFASASIAIWLYPVLKKQDGALALGSVAFRLIEGILGIVSVIGLLSILTLSQEYVKAGAPDASGFQAVGTSVFAARHWAGMLGGGRFHTGCYDVLLHILPLKTHPSMAISLGSYWSPILDSINTTTYVRRNGGFLNERGLVGCSNNGE